MAFTIITLTGKYANQDGSAASGQVDFQLSAPIANGGVVRVPETLSVALDATGSFTVDLASTADASTSPTGATYQVTERITNAPTRTYSVALAASPTTQDLSTLAPAVSTTNVSYVLSSAIGAANGIAPLDSSGLLPTSHVPDLSGTYARVQAAPTTAATSSIYDRRLNIYNLKPYHLRKTRAALGQARAGTGICRIAHCGDSTTEGIGAGSNALQNTLSWPAQFATQLNSAGYNVDGHGLIGTYTNNSPVWTQWTYSPALGTTNGFRQFNSGIGLGWVIATSTSSTATFTSDNAGTVVDIYYLNTGGSFTYAIDGGAAVAVTPPGTQSVGTVTVTGLSNATHTVLITSTSNNAQILGAMVRNSTTKGVLYYNSGLGGSATADWIQGGAWYGQAKLVASGWNPHLTFLMLGTNDLINAVSASTYKTNMQTLITTLKAAGDLVLVSPVPGNSLDPTAYIQALYQLADSNDLPLIDMVDRWKDWSTMNGLSSYYDNYHPNAGGYADLSKCIFTALGL